MWRPKSEGLGGAHCPRAAEDRPAGEAEQDADGGQLQRIQLVGQMLKISKPVGTAASGSSLRIGGPPAALSRKTTDFPGVPTSAIRLPASLRCSW